MLKIVRTVVVDVVKLPLRPGLIKLQKIRSRGRFVTPQGTFASPKEDGTIEWPKAA